MIELFKAELLRFRLWALAAAAIHLAVLALMSRVVDLAQQPVFVYQVFAMCYAAGGTLLGLYQMGGYRRPNQWLHLLHRPLHRLRVATALTGAGALSLLASVALPILLLALYQDGMTARVVDLRHWMMPVAGWLIAACGYLGGAYAMVADRRYSFAALLLPVLFLFSQASGAAMLAVQLAVLAALAGLLAIAFRPDPVTAPRSLPATVATAVPVQLAAYFLLWMAGFGMELAWTLTGTHPLNMPAPPPQGHIAADHADGRDLLQAGIAGSAGPDAALWREQIALSDAYTRYPLRALPQRQAMTNPAPAEFDDALHGTRWVFSHDDLRYHGYGVLDRRARGTLGAGEAQAAFPAPTLPYAEDFVYNARAAYQFDPAQRRVFERMRLPAGEVLAGPPEPAGDNVLALSDRAAYFYPGREAANGLDLLRPLARVPLPGPVGNLSRVDVVELLDGYLVSFTYSWGVWSGELAAPYQLVVRVDARGATHPVARRALQPDLPPAYTTRTWWLSPVLRTLCLSAQDLFAAPDPLRAKPGPLPRPIAWLALACCLASLLGAIALTGRQAHRPHVRWTWVLLCGAIGLPALASVWLLYPRREPRAAASPAVLPAAA